MKRKWEVLSEYLHGTGKYYDSRVSPRSLAGRRHAHKAALRETQEECGDISISAFVALWRTKAATLTYEIGTFCIIGKQNGLRNELLAEIVALAPPGADLFLITPVQSLADSAMDAGFTEVQFRTQDELNAWCKSVGFAADRKPPEGALAANAGQKGSRRLFVRKADQ